jgi:hypothetical protein
MFFPLVNIFFFLKIPSFLSFLTSANALGENEKRIEQAYSQQELSKPVDILRLDSMAKYCLVRSSISTLS